jgi:hypothetical protein
LSSLPALLNASTKKQEEIMTTLTESKVKIERLSGTSIPAAGPEYVVTIANGGGSLQYPDSNGGILNFAAGLGTPIIYLVVDGISLPVEPGIYKIPAITGGMNLEWNLSPGQSFRLGWSSF